MSHLPLIVGLFVLCCPGLCLAANEVEPNNNAATANPIAVDGDVMLGQIAPSADADWYAFTAAGGAAYTIATSSTGGTDVDTVIEVIDTDGLTWLASDDDGGPGLYSALSWQCPAGGTYYVSVMGYDDPDIGDYQLQVYSIVGDPYEPDDTMGTATPIGTDGTVQDHTLYPAGDLDWLQFSASAGSAYTIETTQTGPPAGTDTHLFLYDAAATQLDENDDNFWGDDLYSRIDWTCPADGTYYILVRVSTYYQDPTRWVGPYSISVSGGGGGGGAATTVVAQNVSGNVGQTVQLTASLTSAGGAPPMLLGAGVGPAAVADGGPLAGKTLDFEVDGVSAGSATTDDSGVAAVPYTILGMGDKTFTASFAGDDEYDASSDEATVTVYNGVTGIGLFLSANPIAAGETTTATVVDAGGNIITAACRIAVSPAAGGHWTGNDYTGHAAGTWTVVATYGPLSDSESLTVTHGAVCGVDISPDAATITTAGSQTYTVVAADLQDNMWTPDPSEVSWTHDGGGAFAANTYTPDASDAGSTLDICATVEGVDSDHAALTVTADSGPGLVLAWDRDDRNFYLCANPADPQSADVAGLIPAANGTYIVNGVSVTVSGAAGNRAVTINNSHLVVNSLRVRWYTRGGGVYCAYMYSTIDGVLKTATYRSGLTYVDGQYRDGLWGLTHTPDAPDPSAIAYGATQQ